MEPEQKRIFQAMTAEQKLNIALKLYYSAMELKAAGLQAENPEWGKEKIKEQVRKIFLYART
jgi:hypothetical protein